LVFRSPEDVPYRAGLAEGVNDLIRMYADLQVSAGVSVAELKEALSTMSELKRAGFTLDRLGAIYKLIASFLSVIPTLDFLHISLLNSPFNLIMDCILFLLAYILRLTILSDRFINVRRNINCKVNHMEIVTVTAKGQLTIPVDLRRELGITDGSKLIVVREGKTLKVMPVPKLSGLVGVDKELFKGRKPSKEIEATRKEWTEDFEKRLKED